MAQGHIKTVTLYSGTVDASEAPKAYFKAPADISIVNITRTSSTVIAEAATNIATLDVDNVGIDNSVNTRIAYTTTDSDDVLAEASAAKIPNTLETNESIYLEVSEGSVLEFELAEGGAAGSGDLTNCTLQISYFVGSGAGHSYA